MSIYAASNFTFCHHFLIWSSAYPHCIKLLQDTWILAVNGTLSVFSADYRKFQITAPKCLKPSRNVPLALVKLKLTWSKAPSVSVRDSSA